MNKYTIELSEGMKAMYKMVEARNPSPLISIDNQGEITYHWDNIQKKAAAYVPGAYNDANTSWAYALHKLKGTL